MNKKYIFALVFCSLFILFGINTVYGSEYTEPEGNWSVEIGDEFVFTIGCQTDFNFEDDVWDEIDDWLEDCQGVEDFDSEELFEDLQTLPSVYNIKFTVDNVSHMEDSWDSFDFVNITAEFKLPDETEYVSAQEFLGELIDEYDDLIEKYEPWTGLTEGDLENGLDNLMDPFWMPAMWNVSDNMFYFSVFYPTNIFVTSDFSFTNMFDNLEEYIDDGGGWTDMSNALDTEIEDFSDLYSAFGVTRYIVEDKNYEIDFQLDDVDDDVLDAIIQNAYGTGSPIDTWEEFLGDISIDSPVLTGKEALKYSDDGILINQHLELGFSGSYENEAAEGLITFDVSQGEHSEINGQYDDGSEDPQDDGDDKIPGYEMISLGIVGILGTASLIALSRKKMLIK